MRKAIKTGRLEKYKAYAPAVGENVCNWATNLKMHPHQASHCQNKSKSDKQSTVALYGIMQQQNYANPAISVSWLLLQIRKAIEARSIARIMPLARPGRRPFVTTPLWSLLTTTAVIMSMWS